MFCENESICKGMEIEIIMRICKKALEKEYDLRGYSESDRRLVVKTENKENIVISFEKNR